MSDLGSPFHECFTKQEGKQKNCMQSFSM